MAKQVLMVVTSNGQLGSTGGATGTWLEELAAAYYRFRDSGCTVDIASPSGGKAPLDPASLEQPWITEQGRRFLADATAVLQLEQSRKIDSVDASRLDAIFLVGGAGTAWDFPGSESLRSLVETVDRKGSVVAGVCHGVLGLTTARRADGQLLVTGRKVTGVSNEEEKLVGYETVVPLLPETRMNELGALYSSAAQPFGAHVVRDGNLFTGQNPASAGLLAEAIISTLKS